MFAVCLCARFQAAPKVSHLQAVKRILRYLKGAPKLGLWYPKNGNVNLYAYTDSDYGGCNLDKKSTSGCCQFLGGRLISWQCKKQTCVFLQQLKQNTLQLQAAVHRYHFIRDQAEKKRIVLSKVHTNEQYADLFTKPFDEARFRYLVESIGMMNFE
ncbi:hypothetical protein L1987_54563 [Smallanthus sonchifolius]|uniref:Uncharacterized protein n=1 Tax=Smallanthus sonchifolius TaxID=185202 RepID=A0ACB9E7F3_9ASTR|nr:hypothetical protein L1987_54563 [Smallanthus sonchifolius]